MGESNEDLKALIGSVWELSSEGFMFPSRNSALLQWCLSHGLRVVGLDTLMTIGLYSEPKGACLPSFVS